MPVKTFSANRPDFQDHLRRGTREQYESEWVLVPAGTTREFRHDLGELPWSWSVLRSDTGQSPASVDSSETLRAIRGSATIDPPNIASPGQTTVSATIYGAEVGDFVLFSAPYDLQDLSASAYVQADDTVEVRIVNTTGGAINLASGLWRFLILKADAPVTFTDLAGTPGSGTRSMTVRNTSSRALYFKVRAL
jgi:hypothetical protein